MKEKTLFESNYAKYCLSAFKIQKDAEISSMTLIRKIKDNVRPGFNQTFLCFSTWFLSFPSPGF